MDSFSIQSRWIGEHQVLLVLNGTLDQNGAQSWHIHTLELLSNTKIETIGLDFEKLEHISGEGVMLLSIFLAQAAAQNWKVNAVNVSPVLHAVLHLTRLDTALHFERPEPTQPVSGERWSDPIQFVDCLHPPLEAINLNVHRRQITSPLYGFGRMWLRTYRIGLPSPGLTPAEVMAEWCASFGQFWPPGNSIYPPEGKFFPGAVCLLNLSLPFGLNLATGAVVIYMDENAFTLMTVQGHMFSGLLNFSAYREDERTFAQVSALIRPNDLIYEVSFWFGFGQKAEDKFWTQTLQNLGKHFSHRYAGSPGKIPPVEKNARLINHFIQWRHFTNIWYNAAIRSALHQIFSTSRKNARRI